MSKLSSDWVYLGRASPSDANAYERGAITAEQLRARIKPGTDPRLMPPPYGTKAEVAA